MEHRIIGVQPAGLSSSEPYKESAILLSLEGSGAGEGEVKKFHGSKHLIVLMHCLLVICDYCVTNTVAFVTPRASPIVMFN